MTLRICFIFFSLILMFLESGQCLGQVIVIGARHEIAFSAGVSLPAGKLQRNLQPTLLANMSPSYSYQGRFSTTVLKNIHVGASIAFSNFTTWKNSKSDLYNGSSMTFTSVGPTVMYKPWTPGRTRGNKLNYMVAVTPCLSNISVSTTPKSGINGGSESDPLTVRSTRLSVLGQVGITYILSNSYGLHVIAGYTVTQPDSKIFTDKNYSFVNISAGAFIRLHKDKRYKYSGL